MDFKLRLNRHRGYAPGGGLVTGFPALPMQLTTGDVDDTTLYINQPSVGLAGPSPQMLAVGFNAGTPIQRAVSRAVTTNLSGSAVAFHVRIVCQIQTLTPAILWAQTRPYSPENSTLGPRLWFRYESPYGWVFVYENWWGTPDSPTLAFNLHSGYGGYSFSNPGWYDVIVSISRSNYGDSAQLRVNGVKTHSRNGSLFSNAESGPLLTGYAWSVADSETYDGILGQTEGTNRFVGKVAYFSALIGNLLSADTGSSSYLVMTDNMAARLYSAVMCCSPPVQCADLTPRIHKNGVVNSLQRRRLGLSGAVL